MAARNSRRAQIMEQVEQQAQLCTDSDGRVDLAAIVEGVSVWLRDERPDLLSDAQQVALDHVRAYDEAKRPRLRSEQLGLFAADVWLPTGEGERVLMPKVTREQFARWFAIETQEQVASNIAYGRKSQYFSERFNAWQAQHRTLVDVEREVFGWQGDD